MSSPTAGCLLPNENGWSDISHSICQSGVCVILACSCQTSLMVDRYLLQRGMRAAHPTVFRFTGVLWDWWITNFDADRTDFRPRCIVQRDRRYEFLDRCFLLFWRYFHLHSVFFQSYDDLIVCTPVTSHTYPRLGFRFRWRENKAVAYTGCLVGVDWIFILTIFIFYFFINLPLF
jgi:hypothetical protein